jgi:uncharacterized protein (TIGR02118 family)
MVKFFSLIPKRPDISDEQFHAHWRGPHAELALRLAAMRRYVQSHRVRPDLTGLPAAPYEGIAAAWFDDLASADSMATDPNYIQYVQPDEQNFVDLPHLAFVATREEVLTDGAEPAKAKAMLLFGGGRAAGPEAAERAAAAAVGVRRATISRAVDEAYADDASPAYDAVLELWWPDRDALERAWPQVRTALADARVDAFAAEDVRVIWP